MVRNSMRNSDLCNANHNKKRNFFTHAINFLVFCFQFRSSDNKIKILINRIIRLRWLLRHSGLKMVWILMRNDDFCAANHNKKKLLHPCYKSSWISRSFQNLCQQNKVLDKSNQTPWITLEAFSIENGFNLKEKWWFPRRKALKICTF